MRILAIDTALGASSVALLDTETNVILAEETQEMARGHAEAIVPMVARVVVAAGLNFQSIDRFGVVVGPGSFTGIRIGIAAARGFALAHRKPSVGVSCLSAFAAPLVALKQAIPIVCVIDARHGMVFFQLFGSDGRVQQGPMLISVDDLVDRLGERSVHLVGDASDIVAAALRKARIGFRPLDEQVLQGKAVDIGWVARLAALADPAIALAKPLYLREANVTSQDSARLRRHDSAGSILEG